MAKEEYCCTKCDCAGMIAPGQPLQPQSKNGCDCTVKFIIGTDVVVGENVFYLVGCDTLNYSFYEY